jgi:hypothetical protein
MEKIYFEKEFKLKVNDKEFTATASNLLDDEEREDILVDVKYQNEELYIFFVQDYEILWLTIENEDYFYKKLVKIIERNITYKMSDDLMFADDFEIKMRLSMLKFVMLDLIKSIDKKDAKDALIDVREFFYDYVTYLSDEKIIKLIYDLDIEKEIAKMLNYYSTVLK